MFKFTLLLLSLSFTAQASYFATFCSNASGSIKWRTGHNSNTIDFTTSSRTPDTKTLSFRDIKVKETEKMTIKKNETKARCIFSSNSTYVAKVKITATEGSREALEAIRSITYNKDFIETEVICQYQMNGRASCDQPTESTSNKK